ncbi:beta-ketoacyl synthase N-terminal-like domain-containing protein [Lutimonas sp.]|uniref:beta-ketoacyl synthase N-terminal-like domain-containing protein n=1 Tax=Lutimonas sp. TaxID=1872403 RepID=UPI003D9BF52B
MKEKVSIISMASVSAMGSTEDEIWQNYLQGKTLISNREFKKFTAFTSDVPERIQRDIDQLKKIKNYKDLDPSVLMAMYASRAAFKKASWEDAVFGVNIGSSRGATHLFEKYFEEFSNNEKGHVNTLSSPTTTLGNISSWVGHDLQNKGPVISHSIACSTALHGIINGIAWLGSGMSDKFLAGGSEASNTAFTIAQMKALKIYANQGQEYPCLSLDMEKSRNTFVLGEAAAVFCLERGSHPDALAYIEGIGYATEPLKHNISISTNADCFQKSMRMALQNCDSKEVDVIVTHTPGTIKGDSSECNAIKIVFGDHHPALTSNKWLIGHSLGASGGMSLEMAILMMKNQQFVPVPFGSFKKKPDQIKKVLVNAVGFGGNAVSVLLSLD